MLIGYNNDIEHRGVTFHIQTEDRGAADNKIETQLFHGGAILDTKITSYEEIVEGLEGEQRNQKIKSVMKASHRSLFKNVLAGKYDEQVGLEPQEKSTEELQKLYREKMKQFQPGQDRVPQAAVELEEEGIDALEQEAEMEGFEDPADQDHMDLSKLKDKLKGMDGDEEQDVEAPDIQLGDESEISDTQITEPPPEVEQNQQQLGSGNSTVENPSVVADTDKLETQRVQPETLETDQLDTERLEEIEASWDDDTRKKGDRASAQKIEVESTVSGEQVELVSTGVSAWNGCEEPNEDLAIDELVEDFLAG